MKFIAYYRVSIAQQGKNGKVLGVRNQKSADEHARMIAPKITLIPADKRQTVAPLTVALNDYQIPTAKGGKWHRQSTQRLLNRLNTISEIHFE